MSHPQTVTAIHRHRTVRDEVRELDPRQQAYDALEAAVLLHQGRLQTAVKRLEDFMTRCQQEDATHG